MPAPAAGTPRNSPQTRRLAAAARHGEHRLPACLPTMPPISRGLGTLGSGACGLVRPGDAEDDTPADVGARHADRGELTCCSQAGRQNLASAVTARGVSVACG
jgi:hypothetical protein